MTKTVDIVSLNWMRGEKTKKGVQKYVLHPEKPFCVASVSEKEAKYQLEREDGVQYPRYCSIVDATKHGIEIKGKPGRKSTKKTEDNPTKVEEPKAEEGKKTPFEK